MFYGGESFKIFSNPEERIKQILHRYPNFDIKVKQQMSGRDKTDSSFLFFKKMYIHINTPFQVTE